MSDERAGFGDDSAERSRIVGAFMRDRMEKSEYERASELHSQMYPRSQDPNARLRDEFAMAALPTMLRDCAYRPPYCGEEWARDRERISEACYELAESMLRARSSPSKPPTGEPA